jgi:hypothetical protein
MALNFEQSGKFDDAESLYTTMLKKYKQNKSVWINACLFYVRNSKLDTARGVFQRALSILDKKERKRIFLSNTIHSTHPQFGEAPATFVSWPLINGVTCSCSSSSSSFFFYLFLILQSLPLPPSNHYFTTP